MGKPAGIAALTSLLLICGCMSHRDALKVSVAGIKPVKVEGLGMQMMINLRVQNPNDVPVDYNGVALEMSVEGKPVANGVSDTAGSVPRFGETVISVPVKVSAITAIRQAVGLVGSGNIDYKLKGKVHGPSFGSKSFSVKGELDMPDFD